MSTPDPHRRPDMREALQRDASRRARREVGHRSFWQALGVLGMVGWPIAILAAGGALGGRYLDRYWHTGGRFTLILLTAGTALGVYIAWDTIRRHHT